MKKAAFLLAILMCMACFAACGQGTGDAGTGSLGDAPEASAPAEGTSGPGTAILDAGPYSHMLQVGGRAVSLPAPYTTLLEAGCVNVDDDYNDDYLMDGQAYKTVSLQINDTVWKVSVYNDGTERIALKDGMVRAVYSTQGPDVVYPGGVAVGGTLQQLTDAWGQPDEDRSQSHGDSLTYVYFEYPLAYARYKEMVPETMSMSASPEMMAANGYYYVVAIDRANSQVSDIQGYYSVPKEEMMQPTEAKIEYMDGTGVFYSFPAAMAQNRVTMGGRGMMVIEVEGVAYAITVDTPSSSLNVGPLSEEELLGQLNQEYQSEYYEPELVFYEEGRGAAAGYYEADGIVRGKTVCAVGERVFTGYSTSMAPIDPAQPVSPQAMDAFKEIVNEYLRSIRVEGA